MRHRAKTTDLALRQSFAVYHLRSWIEDIRIAKATRIGWLTKTFQTGRDTAAVHIADSVGKRDAGYF